MTISTRLCLHAADVTLVLDAPAGQLPAVLHWGARGWTRPAFLSAVPGPGARRVR